jgi:hypothetical protein
MQFGEQILGPGTDSAHEQGGQVANGPREVKGERLIMWAGLTKIWVSAHGHDLNRKTFEIFQIFYK